MALGRIGSFQGAELSLAALAVYSRIHLTCRHEKKTNPRNVRLNAAIMMLEKGELSVSSIRGMVERKINAIRNRSTVLVSTRL